jgi:hypothetical protein
MKRIFLTATAASTLALAAPAVASAHHSTRHHGARHASARKHHAITPRILTFGAPLPTSPAPAPSTTPPVSSQTTSGVTPVAVASFTNGLLTITLSNGSSVSGMVTEATELKCPAGASGASSGDDDENAGQDEHGGSGPSSEGRHDEGQSGGDGGGDGHDDEGAEDARDGESRDGADTQQGCPAGALASGAAVREAELSVSSAGSVWEKVELAG